MTLSTKILLSYLALGGGVGGIYIGVNGGIGNKAVEEVSEPDNTPDVAAQPPAVEKTEEHAEEKDKGVGTEETPEIKTTEQKGSTLISDEIKEESESTTNDETAKQAKISDNSEEGDQKTDLELRVIEVVASTDIKIQVTKELPDIKHQALTLDASPPAPKETKENVVVGPKEVPTSNQPTPKTKETSDKSAGSSEGEEYGWGWITSIARGYEEQRQAVATAIKTIRQSLS